MIEPPHLALLEARRAVALGKFDAFAEQAAHLAKIARAGVIERTVAIDGLHDIAIAHGLYDHGVDLIQSLLADAFTDERSAICRAAA